VAGSCEYDSEPSGFIGCGEFLDQTSDCSLLKDYAPWSWLVGWLCFSLFNM
jgi:hypothetical protein